MGGSFSAAAADARTARRLFPPHTPHTRTPTAAVTPPPPRPQRANDLADGKQTNATSHEGKQHHHFFFFSFLFFTPSSSSPCLSIQHSCALQTHTYTHSHTDAVSQSRDAESRRQRRSQKLSKIFSGEKNTSTSRMFTVRGRERERGGACRSSAFLISLPPGSQSEAELPRQRPTRKKGPAVSVLL